MINIINLITKILLFMSLLMFELSIWRNRVKKTNQKIIVGALMLAVLLSFVKLNAENFISDMNTTKDIIYNALSNTQKSCTEGVISIADDGSKYIINTIESIKTNGYAKIKSIIVGHEVVVAENDKTSLETDENTAEDKSEETKGTDEAALETVPAEALTQEEYNIQKLVETGLTEEESKDILSKLEELNSGDVNKVSVGYNSQK